MGNSMNLLIIGGTGFIGQALTREAIELGYTVSVISLHQPKSSNVVKGAQYFECDISSLEATKSAIGEMDVQYVVNLGGYVDHSSILNGGSKVIDDHFNGVKNLVLALNWDALKGFVQIGSSDEYGNLPGPQNEDMREQPISPYSLGKLASTQFLQMLHRVEGFPATILRLFLVYGPKQSENRFLPQVIGGCLRDETFATSEGKQLRDFCHISDVIRGVFLALLSDAGHGEVFNLASGVPVSIRTVLMMIQKYIGKGKPDFGAYPYREGENMALFADVQKAKSILNWEAEISIEDGLVETISFYADEFDGGNDVSTL